MSPPGIPDISLRVFWGDNRTGCLCATRQGIACITLRDLLMKPEFTLKYCEVQHKESLPCRSSGASAGILLPSGLVALGDWSWVSIGTTGPVERPEVKPMASMLSLNVEAFSSQPVSQRQRDISGEGVISRLDLHWQKLEAKNKKGFVL